MIEQHRKSSKNCFCNISLYYLSITPYRFVTKSTITDYIDLTELLERYGGQVLTGIIGRNFIVFFENSIIHLSNTIPGVTYY